MDQICDFNGEFRWLSNFYEASVEFEGIVYNSAESAYQAQKFKEPSIRAEIAVMTPSVAKRFAKNIKLPENWHSDKIIIMYEIVRQKFLNNPMLKKRLVETGSATLIEGNNWGDREWGMVKNSAGIFEGKNLLGKILMRIRKEIQSSFVESEKQYLLQYLSEEACEVSQAVSKIIRFGEHDKYKDYPSPLQQLQSELNDLEAVRRFLIKHYQLPLNFDESAIDAKFIKIQRMLDYSKSVGIL